MPPASSRASETAKSGEGATLRMRDLVQASGLPRETIHFYLTQGLLPKPIKTGRNTALYGAEHLDRLQRIKDLQDRHFLPLRAIKAVLEEGEGGAFTNEQEAMLRRVRASLPAATKKSGEVPLSDLVPSRISRREAEEIRKLGLIAPKGRGSDAKLSAEDAGILECWAALRAIEKPGEPPFDTGVLAPYRDAADALVEREARELAGRFTHVTGERGLEMIEQSEPLILRLLLLLRRKKIAALLEGFASPRS